MSRGYRITWVTEQCRVEGGDTLRVDVGLMAILGEAEMASLLREELARDGWCRDDDGAMSREEGGVSERLSPDAKSVTATVRTTRQLTAQGVDKESARKAAEALSDDAKARLQAEAAQRLAGHEATLRGRLGAAVQRAYVAALRAKAASMGDVESVHERQDANGEHEVVIRVRV